MDWIERWTGFAPDGGDGSVELFLTAAALAVVVTAAILYLARMRKRRRPLSRPVRSPRA